MLTLLDDHEGEHGDIGSNNTPTDGLTLALAGAARAEAGVSVGEEETDTMREKNTLFHGKTLLVVSTCNADDIALPFVSQGIGWNFGTHTLVIEDTAKKVPIS